MTRVNWTRGFLLWIAAVALAVSARLSSAAAGAAVDPFARPVTPIQTVVENAERMPLDEPVKVQGAVTLHHRDGPIFIQSGDAGIFASARTNSSVRVGDRVEVVGHLRLDGFSPTLAHCVYRAIGGHEKVRPIAISGEQLQRGTPDMRLVRVTGPLLVSPISQPDAHVLHIRVGPMLVSLTLEDFANSPLSQLRAGSILQATGVCSIGADAKKRPTAVRLHLRSGDDVVVLAGPPWWTPQRTAAAVGVGALLVVLIIAWATLRRQKQLSLVLEQRVRERTAELESANRDLESFSYSVSHDLRAPVRALGGFSEALLEDYGDKLEGTGKLYLQRVAAAAQDMNRLIDGMLLLARVTRAELRREPVDLSAMASALTAELKAAESAANGEVTIQPAMHDVVDPSLVRIVFSNLLANAWKFTNKAASRKIQVGRLIDRNPPVYFVRDNGAGFDPQQAAKLFQAFQRLHTEAEYEGTGIGLATVQKIVQRHGGRVWAEGKVNDGACFYFTLHPAAG